MNLPFVRIADGVYASCPELCFVQLALVLPLHELLKAGDALCGMFFIDPSSRNGLGSRTPLTSKRRIESFVRRNAGCVDRRQRSRRCDSWRIMPLHRQRRFFGPC